MAHVHTDGSLHNPLPLNLATEAIRTGWEGLVSLHAPRTIEEVDVVSQIIVEFYNHVTARSVSADDF